MRKIVAFDHVSLDGYFAGPNGELDWIAHDDEDHQYSIERSRSSDTLIFGRTTYEIMASYWPAPTAIKNDPIVAGIINRVPKIVFSKTLRSVEDGPIWKNVKLYNEIDPEEFVKMKREGDGVIAILGSGTIVQQFANYDLIDEYGLLVNPVILGSGKYLFKDVHRKNLELLDKRTFRNGKILLTYAPA